MARVGKEFRDAVAFAADQFGITVEAARTMIQEDWTRNGNMVPGKLSGFLGSARYVTVGTLTCGRP
jgi:hypothetical protein